MHVLRRFQQEDGKGAPRLIYTEGSSSNQEIRLREITTSDAPRPAGHYAQAVEHQGMVWVSGQLPRDPKRDEIYIGSIEEQTEQALKNVAAILKHAGSGKDRIVKLTVYVSDMTLWSKVDAVVARFFGNHRPARTVVPVNELHYGFQVEIDAVATAGKG